VVIINFRGINIIEKDKDCTKICVAAGEVWHTFLEYCLRSKLYGLENLALIPGKCGAAPIQNIGAYGVEQSDFLDSVIAYDILAKKEVVFTNKECNFAYRYSIFKTNKNLIITDIIYKLKHHFEPNLKYKDLHLFSEDDNLSAEKLFNTICEIRKNKIPYPEEVGNAGSFFKNPTVDEGKANQLKSIYPDMPVFENAGLYKLSAGWLIEHSGNKGKKFSANSDAMVSDKHSLILINNGNARGIELKELSEYIINSVNNKYGILLEREVNII